MYVWDGEHMHVFAGACGSQRSDPLEMELQGMWAAWRGCWELHFGLREEQQAFLTAEPPIHSPFILNKLICLKKENYSVLHLWVPRTIQGGHSIDQRGTRRGELWLGSWWGMTSEMTLRCDPSQNIFLGHGSIGRAGWSLKGVQHRAKSKQI